MAAPRIPAFRLSRMQLTLLLAALATIALLIPLAANNYVLEVLTNAWFYAILCLGLNIVVGYAGLVIR